MTETPPPFSAAEPIVKHPRKWLPSIVWIIPFLAALIGASLVLQTLWERGPTITVSFSSAEGIEVNKTKVKFKDVDIGEVTAVHLAADHSQVLVTIELLKEARQFAVADSRFWVAKPRLAGGSVSGLETLMSGSYIAVDGGHSTETSATFVGLETPPVVASDVPGKRFILLASDIGSLDVGSPVFFRRIPVGHIESYVLNPNGRSLTLGVFIKAPYDRFVTADARFWHSSGIDLQLDAGGLKLDTQSLATILLGGVAFESFTEGDAPTPAPEGTQFPLAADHSEALKNPDTNPFAMKLRFHQSVRGLAVGASVNFLGVDIGHVRSIELNLDKVTGELSPIVIVDIYPDRLPTSVEPSSDQATYGQRALQVGEAVRRGLRAQLQTGSLLTGQLFIAMDFFPAAAAARFDASADPVELPTVPGDLEELYQQVQTILHKLNKVPFDTLGQDAHVMLTDLDRSLKQVDAALRQTNTDVLPQVRDSLLQIRKTMEELQATMAGDSPLQQDARQALKGLTEATRSLKSLSDSLERQPESLLRGKKEPKP